jgi:hypothetical protein
VASTHVSAPWWAAASQIASRSATRPSIDCTALTATNAVEPSIASATALSGTVSSRAPATRNGHSTDVKSRSALTTRAPGPNDRATRPVKAETWPATATSPGAAPCSAAHASRDAPTARSQTSQCVRPWRHSSSAPTSASTAGRGGSP